MMRRDFGLACLTLAAGPVPVLAAARPMGVLYKNPQCSCCEAHADYLRQYGYQIEVKPSFDLVAIKRQSGVPETLDGCHTMLIGGYVVEGHVPAGAIDRLLAERPVIKGISVPGMPAGSPGMLAPGEQQQLLTVYEISTDPASGATPKVFGVM
ncbi:MAG: DUF411 domain-containing protein [Geminicoccaceae bacterium]